MYQFYDITFQDFTSPIINIFVNITKVNVDIDGCKFNNFSSNVQNVSMISVSTNVTKSYPVYITLSNSLFTGPNSSNDNNSNFSIISLSSTTLEMQKLNISNIFATSFISSINSYITIFNSDIYSTSTQFGKFRIQDTTFKSHGTIFTNCCQFINSNSFNGGSIYASNTGPFQPTLSNINSFNTPLAINNKTQFITSNTAKNGGGGLFYVINTTLTIQSSSLSSNNSNAQCDGYLVNTQGSNVFITNNTIGFMNDPPAISCSSSFVNISGIIFMDKISQISVTCNKCNMPGYCGNVDDSCTGTTSFSTSSSQSSTTGGSATFSSGSTSGKQPLTVSSST
ncbi:hypothetical protein ACTFIV_005936 [Dictyostelium citrinum]